MINATNSQGWCVQALNPRMGWMQITDTKPTREEAEGDMVRTVNTGLEKRVYEVVK